MTSINNSCDLSNDINKYLNNLNDKLTFNNKKTKIHDAFIFKLLYTMANTTQEQITMRINKYKHNDISRTAYNKKINNIDICYFENFYKYLNERIDYYFHKESNNFVIYAVDGTYIQLKESLNKKCKRAKNNSSVTCLSTGIFNVTYNEPTILKFENNETSKKNHL